MRKRGAQRDQVPLARGKDSSAPGCQPARSSAPRSSSMPSPVSADSCTWCASDRALGPRDRSCCDARHRHACGAERATIAASAAGGACPHVAVIDQAQHRRPSTVAQVRSMPMRSIGSSASAQPAVSMTCSGTPSIWIVCAHRVARRAGDRRDDRDARRRRARSAALDLPTFGWPASTTLRPSRSSAPCARAAEHRVERCAHALRAGRAHRPSRGSRSPLRGNRASPRPACAARSAARRSASISRENAPASERAALRAAASVLGVDQVGDGFGLRQVELVVEEGALA